MAIAATVSWASSGNGLSTRLTFAIALMGGASVFTYQLAGHPWQPDTHMYFFAALACLAAYCDYRPILAGAVAVALHHLVLNFLLPAAVYPGGADLGRVVLHAVILLIEAGVLSWLAVKLSGLFETTAQKTAEAEAANAAEARANIDRMTARTAGQAGRRRGAPRTRRGLRAQDRRHRRGGHDCRSENTGPVIDHERQQCGNDTPDGCRRHGLEPGFYQCRDGRIRDGRTHRVDQQHRPAGDPFGGNRGQGRRAKRAAPIPSSRGLRPVRKRSVRW